MILMSVRKLISTHKLHSKHGIAPDMILDTSR